VVIVRTLVDSAEDEYILHPLSGSTILTWLISYSDLKHLLQHVAKN